ncbi:hypothetical protein P6N53_11145 [Desulforamulus aquiferis]|uniref:Lipoprotein n=2 Tax=Desulforamulus aquiferis TaxID=1397668 RepID=A0AAW7ZDD9_9FIRM|nr:hypothetical protein [Desulforamulus aquiferis]
MHIKNIFIVSALLLLVVGCGQFSEEPNVNNSTNDKNVHQSLEELVEQGVEIARAGDLSLLATKQGNVFKGITLQTKAISKTFPWTSLTTYYPDFPSIHVVDVDGDGKIIVILLKETGTGFHIQEIHVLNFEDLNEIVPEVENPLKYIEEKVTSKIIKNNGKVTLIVECNDKIIEKTFNESDAGVWNEHVAFGGIVRFKLHNNHIYAEIPGTVASTWYVVTAIVEYGPNLNVVNVTIEDIDQ